jgi:probable DNA repair protein
MQNPIILCPTARLVRAIQADIAQSHVNNGQTQWQSAPVMTLQQWLCSLIETGLLVGDIKTPQALLSPFNEQLLWQQVITESLNKNAFGALFDVAGLAKAASEANQYMVAWRLHVPREQMAEESRQFLHWQRAFQARCNALNVLESVRYFDWQLDCLAQDNMRIAAHTAFAGFDQTAPQEQRLRNILTQKNIEVSQYATTNANPAQAQHVSLDNIDAECRAAVAWAKQQLTQNPNATLAIVAPQLSEIRNQLADLLDDTFHPHSVNPSQFDAPRDYNFSLGTPLSQQPIIQAALNLLRLFSSYNWQQVDLSAVLLSPYWSANQQEADARAMLDAKMREHLPAQFTLAQLTEFANFQHAKGLPIAHLLANIKAAAALLSNKKSSALQWAQTLADILVALNWPGERSITSIEFQALNAWQKALQQLQQLDVLGRGLYQAEAVQVLQQICLNLVFQAETINEPSLQILGIMEALSAPVDAVWCIGMNDHIWPPPARPNPLLPASIQRAAKLPNADNSVQAAFAENVQQRLLHSADHITFSSSKMDGNSQLRASPLMNGIAMLEDTKLAVTLAENLSALGNADLVFIKDNVAPTVLAGEHVSGGTGLFRAQAICPAWAFYQYRLGAKSLKTPSNGLDSMLRGILVHDVLAAFWKPNEQYRHFADLRDMSEEDLTQAINAAIQTAFIALQKQQIALSPSLLALEHERLFKLVRDWLQYEIVRNITFEMVACEAEKKVLIGSIEVSLKIDRIHQLEHGSIEFVDYKTGQKPDMNNWAADRIIEPQLPIYAVFYGEVNVGGVQFGMVKTAEHAFSGISEVSFDTDKRKPKWLENFANWQALLNHWQASLEAIASEIKTGEAAIKFEDEKQLNYCEVLPLLRLPERQLQFERFKGDNS